VQEAHWPLQAGFVGLAYAAQVTKFGDLTAHLGPPIPAVDVVHCLLGTEVTQNSVCLVNDCSHKAIILHYLAGDAQDFLLPSTCHIDESISHGENSIVLSLFANSRSLLYPLRTLSRKSVVGNGKGIANPQGSWVQVPEGMGTGMDFGTRVPATLSGG